MEANSAPSSVLLAVIRRIQLQAALNFPNVMNASAAEWWCHCRPHSSGHQLHFDSDDEGRGGVRNPIVSCVVYLSPSGVGGETLVTSQESTGTQLARSGYLCAGRRNRLLTFRGNLLHGVMPGAGYDLKHKKGRRVTWMVAFWKRITVQDKPGHGAARPVSRIEGKSWAQPLLAPPTTIPVTAETSSAARAPRPASNFAFYKVPVWRDVDAIANEQQGVPVVDDVINDGAMRPYDEFFQFA